MKACFFVHKADCPAGLPILLMMDAYCMKMHQFDWTMQYLLLYNRFSASHLVSALGSNVSLAVLCGLSA